MTTTTTISSEQIRELQEARGETVPQFARSVGVSARTVARWRNDVGLPRTELVIRRLARMRKAAGL